MARGKRAGDRRASRPAGQGPKILGYAVAITAAVIAWGYLVYAAIDFGSAARGGNGGAWGLLVLASLGAAACLFVGLMFASRLAGALGFGPRAADQDRSDDEPPPPRQPGGRRIAR